MAHPASHPHGGQPADPLDGWARQRQWQVKRHAHRGVLDHLRGPTYGPQDQVILQFGAWGWHQDLPVLGIRLAHHWTAQVGYTSGSHYRSQTTGGAHQVALVALESPAPLPDLGVYKHIGGVRRFVSMLAGHSMVKGGIDIGPVPGAKRFRIESTQEAFARWFLTEDVFRTLRPSIGETGDGLGAALATAEYEFFFTFTGRIVLVWSLIPDRIAAVHNGLDVVDTAVALGYWLYRRVPQQAFGPASGWPGMPPGPLMRDLVAML